MGSMFEIAMLSAFTASWIASLATLLRSGTADGKSLAFVTLSAMGCCAGMAANVMGNGLESLHRAAFWIFALNLVLTGCDAALTLRLRAMTNGGQDPDCESRAGDVLIARRTATAPCPTIPARCPGL